MTSGTYEDFLLPGIFAQTLAFTAGTTAIGMTDDMSRGLVDRFRSLPMGRPAFLTGRTLSDVVYNAGIPLVLMLSGLAVGWRIRDGILEFLGGGALSRLPAYAMSYLGVWLGQLVPTVEVATQVKFTVLFPGSGHSIRPSTPSWSRSAGVSCPWQSWRRSPLLDTAPAVAEPCR